MLTRAALMTSSHSKAMVHYADSVLSETVDLLRTKKMWDDTLVIFTSDNGGAIYGNGSAGGNNWPVWKSRVAYGEMSHFFKCDCGRARDPDRVRCHAAQCHLDPVAPAP